MSEERKPLTDFRLTRSLNGGWIISVSVSFATQADTYSYSSDHDMLAALPELIGAGPSLAELATLEAMAKAQMRDVEVLDGYHLKNGYENGD